MTMFITVSEVMDAWNGGLITRLEARELLGLLDESLEPRIELRIPDGLSAEEADRLLAEWTRKHASV